MLKVMPSNEEPNSSAFFKDLNGSYSCFLLFKKQIYVIGIVLCPPYSNQCFKWLFEVVFMPSIHTVLCSLCDGQYSKHLPKPYPYVCTVLCPPHSKQYLYVPYSAHLLVGSILNSHLSLFYVAFSVLCSPYGSQYSLQLV
jgi:hypothetical protein